MMSRVVNLKILLETKEIHIMINFFFFINSSTETFTKINL